VWWPTKSLVCHSVMVALGKKTADSMACLVAWLVVWLDEWVGWMMGDWRVDNEWIIHIMMGGWMDCSAVW
jgi:hypothetical protein